MQPMSHNCIRRTYGMMFLVLLFFSGVSLAQTAVKTPSPMFVISDSVPPVPTYTIDSTPCVKGIVKDYPDDDSIRQNMSQIILDPSLSKNGTLVYEPFESGVTRTVKWALCHDNPCDTLYAVILFSDRGGEDTTITITLPPQYNPKPKISPLILQYDSVICYKESAMLFANVGYSEYRWSNGTTTRENKVDSLLPGKHKFAYAGKGLCGKWFYSDTVTVTVRNLIPVMEVKRKANTLYVDSLPAFAFYYWQRNDTLVQADTLRYCEITDVGTYTVTVVDAFGCKQGSRFYTVSYLVDVQEDANGSQLLLYPNPITKTLTIEYQSQQQSTIVVSTVQGTEVQQQTVTETGNIKRTIDMSGLAQGTYFIKITSGTHEIVKKIVKE